MSWVQADRLSLAVTCPKCGQAPLKRCLTAYGCATGTHAARKAAGRIAARLTAGATP